MYAKLRLKEIASLYVEQGKSITEIANSHNVTYAVIRYRLKQAKLLRKRTTKLDSPHYRKAVIKSYKQGNTLEDTGKIHGCCRDTVRKILVKAGVNVRGHTYKLKPSPTKIEDNIGYVALYSKDRRIVGWAQVDPQDLDIVKKYRWHVHVTGYVCANYPVYTRMHLLLTQIDTKREVIKFADMNKLNCQRNNLIIMTMAMQTRLHSTQRGASKQPGVAKSNSKNKPWRAYCTVNGKQHHLGVFATEEEAINCSQEWRSRHE